MEPVQAPAVERETRSDRPTYPEADKEPPDPGGADLGDIQTFLVAPDQKTVDGLLLKFIEATGKDATASCACCVCAREMPAREVVTIGLGSLPNPHRLSPSTPHPAHELTNGMLLCPKALSVSRKEGRICRGCLHHLQQDKLPPLSLANDMWVGEIPYQLSNLSLPERLMIAKGFPCAYIVKLYPKQRGATSWEPSRFHNGLKGNVSTYKMNPSQLADVVCGKQLPHPAKLLSATIGVTFVGPRGVKEFSMPDTFRVRRWRVREALIWLKRNNPLYADIMISEERLAELPEDGVPDEIVVTAKHSSDVASLEREREGYVPEYDSEEDGEYIYIRRRHQSRKASNVFSRLYSYHSPGNPLPVELSDCGDDLEMNDVDCPGEAYWST